MKVLAPIVTALALSLTVSGGALAQTDHGHGAQASGAEASPADGQPGPMGGGQAPMMQNMMQMMMPMMMQMHAKMMDGGPDKMGGRGMAMMDRDMMQMMMGPGMMAAPSAEGAGAAMQARLAEFDADGDGSLSLAEFEALHAAMIRETTVDQFQHLDADGDGRITEAEMAAPAKRMNMRKMKHGPSQGSGN